MVRTSLPFSSRTKRLLVLVSSSAMARVTTEDSLRRPAGTTCAPRRRRAPGATAAERRAPSDASPGLPTLAVANIDARTLALILVSGGDARALSVPNCDEAWILSSLFVSETECG